MPTIFEGVVTRENHHTDLLRNLLERNSKIAAQILSLLTDRALNTNDIAGFAYMTQVSFTGPDGRAIPDLLIRGTNFQCILEIKIDPSLGLTEAQMQGYARCFDQANEKVLCFLVPTTWAHRADIQRIEAALHASSIKVRLICWTALVKSLLAKEVDDSDFIASEVLSFWQWRFNVQSLEAEEQSILARWVPASYSASRKLEKTIDQTRDLFHARGHETERETYDVDAYGFYLKRGREYLLWVGIWTKAPSPLMFGFRVHNHQWLEPAEAVPGFLHVDNHNLWIVNSDIWTSPIGIFDQVLGVKNALWPDLL